MKLTKHLLAFIVTLVALLAAVVVVHWSLQLMTGAVTADAGISERMMIAGFVADSIRAVILVLLYTQFANAYNLSKALWFGLLTSLLAGCLSVFYRYGADITIGLPFLLEETIILLLQGVLSGLALYFVYKGGKKEQASVAGHP